MTQLAPKPNSDNLEPESPSPKQSSGGGKGFGWKGIVLGLVIGAIASGFVGKMTQSPTNAPAEPATEEGTPTPSRAVTTLEIQPGAIAQTLEIVGTVAAADIITVTSPRAGLAITSLLVEAGDTVQQGQVLAQLDNAIIQAELQQAKAQEAQAVARLAELKAGARSQEIARAQEQIAQAKAAVSRAKADLTLAQQRLQRNQDLLDSGAIARDTYDESRNRADATQAALTETQARQRAAEQELAELRQGTRAEIITQAEAQLQQAKAQVNLALTRLQETKIVAPRAGKIMEKLAKVGDLTAPSAPLFSIIEGDKLELEAKIPETQLSQVNIGQSVRVNADSDPNLQITGTVREIIPTVDAQSRQATVKIDLPANSTLKPGMLLRAVITIAEGQGFAVPSEAIIPQDGEQARLFLLTPENTVVAVEAQLGELLPDNQVEILSGVKAGDRLIVQGAAYVKDGDLVEVVQPL